MEAPVSASLGVVRSLPAKLQQLLSPEVEAGDGLRLRKAEKSQVRLLKDLLQELIDKYLREPSEVGGSAATARCWMKEVRELSYDIDDFLHELIHGHHTDPSNLRGSKIPWLRQGLTRSRWIADQISQFRARLRDAIRRHNRYNLDRSMMLSNSIASEERPTPPLFGLATASPVGIDMPLEKLQEWLIGGGDRNLKLVSVVGFGGVGKTTLAKELYSKIESQFECRAFVRSSQKPDIRKLLSSILSQVRPERPTDAYSESCELTEIIREHLHHKKYFIIIDDLWASSTWDIVCRALPDNTCGSRVLITTEIDVVAQRCCGHNSEYIFKMGPLRKDEARTLFFSRFPGDQSGSCDQSEVLFDIVSKCGGFPLAIVTVSSLLARQHSLIEQCNYIMRSLSSNLRTNPSMEMEGMKQVLNHCYNNLPCRLKACMLYISIYKEDHIIWKDDLVKQWIAEGFICAKEGKNMVEVAITYFDELVCRGLIEPEYINYSGEVLSCSVHYMILNLIRYKAVEDNFVTAIDCTQSNIRLADKVRRLSLLFGDADDAEQPANLRLSNVRTLVFEGLFKLLPSIVEFRHLRVLILHIWGDQDNISFDLTALRELFGLRYLKMVCNVTLNLQTEMQGLKYLETLKIDSRVMEVPQDIVHLPGLLHLSLPGGTNLPDGIERLASLQTFGCFDLTSNSPENVRSLGELTNILDLRLTCSDDPLSYNLKKNMDQVSSVISNLRNLKYLTLLASGSLKENTLEASTASSSDISLDLSNVSSPPILLEKLELMPQICILSILPQWIGKLCLLSILKIEVMGLSGGDIDILEGLPALTALSLFVRTVPAERVILGKDGFPVLKHLMFICPALCVAFVQGAMPNVRRLKLGFNANTMGECSIVGAGFENLAVLEVLSAEIGGPGAYELSGHAVQSAWEDTIRCSRKNPPIINIVLVDWAFYSDKETHTASATRQTLDVTSQDVVIPITDMGQQGSFSDMFTSVRLPALTSDKEIGCGNLSVALDMHNKETKKLVPMTKKYIRRRIKNCEDLARRIIPRSFKQSQMPPTIGSSKGKSPSSEVGHLTLTMESLRAATNNFSDDHYIGGGTFWSVYGGTLPDMREVAIKRAKADCQRASDELNSELRAHSRLRHKNIVGLVGRCTDSGECMLVYEFMANGTLREQLDSSSSMVISSWHGRLTVALEAACGIEYMHMSSVIHGDIKPANILLDGNWTAKIAGLGLSTCLDPKASGQLEIETSVIAGTLGYMDPEYCMTQRLTNKSDVYGFGVVLLELLTGCGAVVRDDNDEPVHVAEFAVPHIQANIVRVLDPRLKPPTPNEAEALSFVANLAADCVSHSSRHRPSMTEVTIALEDAIVDLSSTASGRRYKFSRSSTDLLHFNLSNVDDDDVSKDTETQGVSTEDSRPARVRRPNTRVSGPEWSHYMSE